MKRIFYYSLALLALSGCGKEDTPDFPTPVPAPAPESVDRAVLVYAVNRSSLSADFNDDSQEMLEAMGNVDADKYQLLVFRTDSDSECGLYRAARNSEGDFQFVLLNSFDRDVTSTHPTRVEEVMKYALDLYPNASYDLIFWGHGMSWKPYFTNHNVAETPVLHAYGGEYNPDFTSTDWTEIDELAEAVPDGRFETIWFDCCYMTGIEVIYEFRDKCQTFVGYPTEVWQYGMAYDIVLPYLMRATPDVTGAARAFYDFYAATSDPVTVAVVDMEHLESVADVAREIVRSGSVRPEARDLLNYSRTASSPFYDFKQFFTMTSSLNGADALGRRLDEAMKSMVIYHAESDKNFFGRPWDVSAISGISTHYYKGTDSVDEAYYRTLDWYRRVYE